VNPFQKFVSEQARLLRRAKKLPPGQLRQIPRQPGRFAGAPKVLIFSPHPDDECIIGGLALRLGREARWNVLNVAVTLGSRRERRAARLRELRNACASLGFGLIVPDKRGWEHIHPGTRRRNRAHWQAAVRVVAKILAAQRPRVIFVPHEQDHHKTHIGTHRLVLHALKTLPHDFTCHVVETEYWGQMTEPNLLVESGVADVAALVAALACHAGEMRRNACHLRLPAWMMDNVRRGAELVGGQGNAAPDFTFATIYRLRKWSRGRLVEVLKRGKFLACREDIAKLFY